MHPSNGLRALGEMSVSSRPVGWGGGGERRLALLRPRPSLRAPGLRMEGICLPTVHSNQGACGTQGDTTRGAGTIWLCPWASNARAGGPRSPNQLTPREPDVGAGHREQRGCPVPRPAPALGTPVFRTASQPGDRHAQQRCSPTPPAPAPRSPSHADASGVTAGPSSTLSDASTLPPSPADPQACPLGGGDCKAGADGAEAPQRGPKGEWGCQEERTLRPPEGPPRGHVHRFGPLGAPARRMDNCTFFPVKPVPGPGALGWRRDTGEPLLPPFPAHAQCWQRRSGAPAQWGSARTPGHTVRSEHAAAPCPRSGAHEGTRVETLKGQGWGTGAGRRTMQSWPPISP